MLTVELAASRLPAVSIGRRNGQQEGTFAPILNVAFVGKES